MIHKIRRRDLLWLFSLGFLFYFFYLGGHPLLTPDEGRYSEVSREMLSTRDFVTPHLNGVALLDKPIFHYWLQTVSIYFFGLKEWALRLWSAVFGVLGCLLIYGVGLTFFNRRTAFLSAVILMTSPLYFGLAHYANLDGEIGFFISATLSCFVLSLKFSGNQKVALLMLAYALAGIAMLTKGLIGFVLPGAIIFSWILLTRRFWLFKQLYLMPGIGLFLVIALPWYVLVQWKNPLFFEHFFLFEQASRFLGQTSFSHSYGPWFYIPVVLVGFFPWTVFFIPALQENLKNIISSSANTEINSFLMTWIVWVLVFFSIPQSKTISYILPAFPAMALVVARYLDLYWTKQRFSPYINYSYLIPRLVLLTGVILTWLNMNINAFEPSSIKSIAEEVKPYVKSADEIVTYDKYYHDLPFYLGQTVTVVRDWDNPNSHRKDGWARELWYGMQSTPAAHEWLINKTTFWQRWHSTKHLLVFLSIKDYPEMVSHVHGRLYRIAESKSQNTVVVSNYPVTETH